MHADPAAVPNVEVNDKLEFRIGNATTGTFSVPGAQAAPAECQHEALWECAGLPVLAFLEGLCVADLW